MKDLIEHINALILENDCVIIPEFGGFVLNKESASIGEVILPPSITVGFNPALKHNDGLLAESYMKSKSISYDTACKQISEAVKKINGFLGAKQPVVFAKLGSFALNEETGIVFTPIKEKLQHPSTIGFSSITLSRLEDIVRANNARLHEHKQFGIKRTLAGVAATAAAVVLFFSLSTPVMDVDRTQRSSFFVSSNKVMTTSVVQESQPSSEATTSIENLSGGDIRIEEETQASIDVAPIERKETVIPEKKAESSNIKSNPSASYYIIIGSCPTEALAKKEIKDLKSDGFSDALMVPSKTRIRIAVAQFENKTVAERYLNNFRAEHSQFADAWLLTTRQ